MEFDRHGHDADRRRSRTLLGLLLLAAVTVVTLDAGHGDGRSPVDPLRAGVSGVLGPVEDVTASALRPVTAIPDYFGDVGDLRDENDRLKAANDRLETQLNASDANANRDAEVTGIARLADASGFDTVSAQVVGVGAAQSFSQTVTIDAGTADGVVPDLTVINADGLVGRVLSATRTTATVLLAIDAKSTVGGRLGASMELGFLTGDGDVSADGALELSLVDHTVSPRVGDTIVTWGSRNGAPYVPGVPIGSVTSVRSSPAELTETALVRPYVDFSSLDVVAVVTAAAPGTTDTAAGAGR